MGINKQTNIHMKTFIGVIFFIILNISSLNAQKTIEFNLKTDILKDLDGKIISEKDFIKKMNDGKHNTMIKDLENGKKEVRLIPKEEENNQNIEFNTKSAIFKDEEGREISVGDFTKKMNGGKYNINVKDLGNGKKEVKLVQKEKESNQKIEFNTKSSIFKDEDGKVISRGDFTKKMNGGKYKTMIKDLENGKKEVKLVPKEKESNQKKKN